MLIKQYINHLSRIKTEYGWQNWNKYLRYVVKFFAYSVTIFTFVSLFVSISVGLYKEYQVNVGIPDYDIVYPAVPCK